MVIQQKTESKSMHTADPYSAFLSLIFSLINATVSLEESVSADRFSHCGIYLS